jgi:hypothetical protein
MTVGWNWRKRWELKLMMKCHCTCTLEIGTCIINNAGRQAAHQKTMTIHVFGRISPNDILYSCFEGNFQRKWKLFLKITKINDIIPLINSFFKCLIMIFSFLQNLAVVLNIAGNNKHKYIVGKNKMCSFFYQIISL